MDTRAEHDDFHYATDSEWDSAAASQLGGHCPDRAWVLTDRDVWHRNPFYTGPAVRHPEDDSDEDYGPADPAFVAEVECPF